MKLSKLSLFLFGAALLTSTGALAGEPNKGSLQIYEKVNVEGKALDPGKYTVTWDGAGPNVQVTVLQGKQTVATFPAHITEQATRNTENAYGSATETDGSRTLTAIYISGKNYSIELDQKAASQPSSTPVSQ
jgi:hypothetical protein